METVAVLREGRDRRGEEERREQESSEVLL